VTGTSIGKGFQGVMKRWNFRRRPRHPRQLGVAIATHGSTGQRQDPARCSRARRWPATWATSRVTTQNLKVVKTDVARGLIMVEGAVPGAKGGWISSATRSSGAAGGRAEPGAFRKPKRAGRAPASRAKGAE
jgi:large subunit ribosomal protein L3